MATTTPILKLALPELEDAADIETAVHPFAKDFEKFVVMRFASSGARTSAISSPVAGMVSFITGTNTLEIYNGSAWIVVARLGAWTTFTPTLVTTGGTLGNGTIAGRWQQIGKTVDLVIQHVVGTTTDFGSSHIAFGNLPVAARATDFQSVSAWLYDSSANQAYPGSGLFEGTTNIRPLSQDGNIVNSAPTPFDWNAGDTIVMSARYEVA